MSANLEIYAAASINFAGGVPVYTWQSGHFTGTITHTGAGDVDLNLNANDGVDATECSVIVTAGAAQAASGLTTFGVVHTSDTVKQITCVQEGAVGGASVRADVDFDVFFVKRRQL